MNYDDLNVVYHKTKNAINELSILYDYLDDKDRPLQRHVYDIWDKLVNINVQAVRKLNSKPVCPNYHNCKGWIEGYACESCDFIPYKGFYPSL